MAVRIIKGDVREKLAELPADYFDCIVTSPPYYGLRDYGTATWEGGDAGCDHKKPANHLGRGQFSTIGVSSIDTEKSAGFPFKDICGKCGARRIDSQIGLEPTLDAYLETMVAVCRELRRVLKPSGICFINIGDSYATGGGYSPDAPSSSNVRKQSTNLGASAKAQHRQTIPGFKPKDLMLVPERLGIALQADGWWVRSHIIWAKKNPMPESCTDRPTSAHETIWMLTKSAKYYWDAEAVKEEAIGAGKSIKMTDGWDTRAGGHGTIHRDGREKGRPNNAVQSDGRNLRNVWRIASQPFPDAHFATFPTELAERCIKAGSSERGCCAECGKPWVRIIESETRTNAPSCNGKYDGIGKHRTFPGGVTNDARARVDRGWQPSCKCFDGHGDPEEYIDRVPARILDPFAGAGTTGLVADRLGRDCTLIDLNTEYAEMALRRIKEDCPMFTEVAAE